MKESERHGYDHEMPVFPVFLDLSAHSVLVVGAGKVAARKIEKLLAFGPRIHVVARSLPPESQSEIEAWVRDGRIRLSLRPYEDRDLEGARLVIVAADDVELQKRIFAECEARRILCNAVDSPAHCSFIFPALSLRDELVIGVSTGGRAPGVAKRVREWLDHNLPEGLAELVTEIAELRKSDATRGLGSQAERVRRVTERLASRWPASSDRLK